MLVLSCDPSERWKNVARAAEALKKGGVIVYPTDTVYGMGCDLLNKRAIERIYQYKKMPRQKPLSFICSDMTQVSEYAQVSNSAFKLMKRLLPGPFTFILQASRQVPKVMVSKQHTVGIRVPAHDVCLELVTTLGNPLVNTSASVSLEEIESNPESIQEEFHLVDLMLTDGMLQSDVSTIIDFTGDEPVVVRQGKGELNAYLRQ
ncbi:threonylcarbamoyl-AMP synthase [bacterium]|nr:threonylcarbamoyl-AMP synthase [bacterium]